MQRQKLLSPSDDTEQTCLHDLTFLSENLYGGTFRREHSSKLVAASSFD